MKYTTAILIMLGLILYACNREVPCTDDGCPSFWENLGYSEDELNELSFVVKPDIQVIPIVYTDTKDEFVYSVNHCITHLYQYVPEEKQIPRELIIAQAALETGWGTSRFANEANNLFGIRTWNKNEPHLLPIPWTKWPGWGVKVFETKCDSVAHYIKIINEVFAYEEFREVRAKILEHGEIPNGLDLAPTLTKYASRANYTELVATLIKYNIRGVYEL